MAAQDELKSLQEKNNELVQKVQYWKMTAAQRENEKLELMKEVNELRLKVIRLKSGGAASARKLDAALQTAGAQVLSYLVEASGAVARSMELSKSYVLERESGEGAAPPPRWSALSAGAERVHRVPPLMIGGQSIQPVVALSRAAFNVNTSRQTSRSPNANRNVTVRAVPMHMLQDVYIPLTRIDVRGLPSHGQPEPEAAAEGSSDDIPFDISMEEAPEDPQNITDDDDYDSSRRLDMVAEEPETEGEGTPPRLVAVAAASPVAASPVAASPVAASPVAPSPEAPSPVAASPVAGPSWRADLPRRAALEPDSTTADNTPHNNNTPEIGRQCSLSRSPSPPARVYTPTLRRRKRSATPPEPEPEPPGDSVPHNTPNANGAALCSRVLQVLLPKLPGAGAGAAGAGPGAASGAVGAGAGVAGSPGKRRALAPRFDAPSPNGATERGIVSIEVESPTVEVQSREPASPPRGQSRRARDAPAARGDRDKHAQDNHRSHGNESQASWRRDSGDSDSGSGAELASEGRARRNRKPVTYKEKPLNRKLRR